MPAGLNKGARRLIGTAMLDAKLTILWNLVEHQLGAWPAVVDDFKSLISRIRENNAKRTVAVHGVWRSWDWSEKDFAFVDAPATAHKGSPLKPSKTKSINIRDTLALHKAIRETRANLITLARPCVKLLQEDSKARTKLLAEVFQNTLANSRDSPQPQEPPVQ